MMADTLDFFKNMWENAPGMNLPGMKHIPGMVMPTLSIDEIDKQIKDLQAVESWLSLNLNMLRTTIQALEMQKATLATLHTMGETFTAAIQPPAMPASAEAAAFQSPFTSPAAATPKPAAEAKPAAHEKTATRKQAETAPAAASPIQPALDATAAMADAATAAMTEAMQPLANPAAWWGMLQDQFKQAVDTAAAMTPDVKTAGGAAKKSAAKSGAKSPAPSAAPAGSAPRRRKTPAKDAGSRRRT